MPYKSVLFIFLFCLSLHFAKSQSFVAPKKATIGVTIAIEIVDNSDLDYIQKNLSKFYGVQKVRVNGEVNISKAAALLELLDDVQDVQLMKFSGELNETDLDKLAWVENVTLFLRNGKEDQILMNNNLGSLNGLTFIFEIAPTDFYFLNGLDKLRSLTIIAPFVAKEAKAAQDAMCKLKNLRHFGISLDKITQLSPQVRSLNYLTSITVIDNLSWITEKYTDNLSVLRRNIETTDNNKTRNLDFRYLANEVELFPWDINHLASVFPSMRFAPIAYDNGDSSLISSFSDFVPLRYPKAPDFEKVHPFNPILEGVEKGEFYFNGNNLEDRIFYLGDKAAVLIPKNCMEYFNSDTTFLGEYSLKIKWMDNIQKLFANAIATDYDSAGNHYQLAASALFEIAAVCNKTNLKLKQGYSIKIVFLDNSETGKRFYAWNKKKNKWHNFYDYDFDFDDSKVANIDFYGFYGNKKTGKENYGVDRTSIDRRFETQGYYYLLSPEVSKLNLEKFTGYWVAPVAIKTQNTVAYTLRRGRCLIGIRKEFVDKKSENGIVRFSIFDKTQTLFPEIKPFENYIFEIQSDLIPKAFSAQFIRNTLYCDVRIVQVGMNYVMDLRTEDGYWRLNIFTPAEKYKLNPARAKLAMGDFLRRYNRYQSIRNQKEIAFDKWVENYHNSATNQTRNTVLFNTKPAKNMYQHEMRIRSLGLFAWAEPVSQPDSFDVMIKFTDEGGVPLVVKKAFIAHAGKFAYATQGAADRYNCIINPLKLQYVACVDDKGRVFVLSGTEYRIKGIKPGTFIYLAMKEVPRSVTNPKELEKLLGLDLKNSKG